ncbi:MAG: hypothetical protein II291_06960, partial [Succinivibrio sp.]|nr:hypothetical protein [Succinivibrio sp.]
MKLKRFVAADMRSALSLIKEELGAEAVIMSNKRVAEGVEIIAGVETDSLEVVKAAAKKKNSSRTIKDDEVTLSKAATSPKTSKVSERKSSEFAKSLLEILERQKQEQSKVQKGSAQANSAKTEPPAPLYAQSGLKDLFKQDNDVKNKVENTHGISSYKSSASEKESEELKKMRQDVDSIRRLLQFELAGLMSDSKKREEPVKAMIYELLLSSGFDKNVSSALSDEIDSDASFNFAWRQLAGILEKKLQTGNDEIITEGGIVTLIGP